MLEDERCGEEIGHRGFVCRAVCGWEVDAGGGSAELGDGLAAGSAGLAGGVVEVGDGDGADADVGAVLADGRDDGRLLGAGGEAVGGVLDVAAGDDGVFGGVEEDRCADTEAAVGGVGVFGCCDGVLLEFDDLAGRKGHVRSGYRVLGAKASREGTHGMEANSR